MDSERMRTVIEEALFDCVRGIQFRGIVDAAITSVTVPSGQFQRAAAQLEQQGHSEIDLSAEVQLFLRASTDLLGSTERIPFRIRLTAVENDLRALARSENDWALAWERGMEPIKEAALRYMKRDVWNIDATLAENSYTFRAAMVLLASELVGPYVERVVTFLEYPPALVQAMAARLYEAKIWEGDEVYSEEWFDPEKGAVAFLLDIMVAEGKLIRNWSEERNQYAYREPENRAVSHFVV
jgi:hypothetical protein